MVVRYADDSVLGFQSKWDTDTFLQELKRRLETFGLSLHKDKTKLIQFGRHARKDRQRRGLGKPETFEFLGFTFYCGVNRTNGGYAIVRETSKKRMRTTLKAVKEHLHRYRHIPVIKQIAWLKRVVRGYMNYFAVPGNSRRLTVFRTEVQKIWYKVLKRRSQRNRLNWSKFGRFANTVLPKARILHPWPEQRFGVKSSR